MKDKYVIEQLGDGFVVVDCSGNRGKFGEAYAGHDKTWHDQPLGFQPFETQSAAEQWADTLSGTPRPANPEDRPMNNTNPTCQPAASPGLAEATGSAPRFFWKQCYELDDGEIHWALCDTESEPNGQCSCCYMVLLADYPNAMDGKPVGEQYMPALIARLLTEHFAQPNSKR